MGRLVRAGAVQPHENLKAALSHATCGGVLDPLPRRETLEKSKSRQFDLRPTCQASSR